MQVWCGIPTLLDVTKIRILETEMDESDKALKVNYSKDKYKLHKAAPAFPTNCTNRALGDIVLIGVLRGEA